MGAGRASRAVRAAIVVAGLFAAAAGSAAAAVDIADAKLEYGTDAQGNLARNMIVFTATVTGDEPTHRITLAFNQYHFLGGPPTRVQSDPTAEGGCQGTSVGAQCDYWHADKQGASYYAGGLAPGTRIRWVITLRQDYPANGGAEVRSTNLNSNNFNKNKAVPGPGENSGSPPSTPGPGITPKRYNLWVPSPSSGQFFDEALGWVVSVDPDRPKTRVFTGVIQHDYTFEPERSSAPTRAVLTTTPPLPVRIDPVNEYPGDRRFPTLTGCRNARAGFGCPVPALGKDDKAIVEAELSKSRGLRAVGGAYQLDFQVECRPGEGETDCEDNAQSTQFRVQLAGDSDIDEATGSDFEGDAEGSSQDSRRRPVVHAAQVAPGDRPRRVEVALLRLRAGQRGFTGTPAEPVTGRRQCTWLANRRGRFQKTLVGARRTCAAPVWLRASGSTRWAFRLTRRLPRGRYVLYSRAVTAAGATEQAFTRRDGNRVTFAVGK